MMEKLKEYFPKNVSPFPNECKNISCRIEWKMRELSERIERYWLGKTAN